MSGDIPNKAESTSDIPAQQSLQLDDSNVSPSYVNYCRITGTPEEIILDFGLHAQPLADTQQAITVSNRIVTSFYSAKRMMLTLQSAIERYENAFGKIEIDVQKRVINRPH
jgi:hypothetical protein